MIPLLSFVRTHEPSKQASSGGSWPPSASPPVPLPQFPCLMMNTILDFLSLRIRAYRVNQIQVLYDQLKSLERHDITPHLKDYI